MRRVDEKGTCVPWAYKKLKVGKHTFRVRAIASGLKGPVTKLQFTVKPSSMLMGRKALI